MHFLHVGKTGGTAVKAALADRYRSGSVHLVLHGHGTTVAQLPENESFAFFLRDPVSRFVSGFNSRRRQGRPRHFVPWRDEERRAFERFPTSEALALGLSASQPDVREAAVEAMRSIRHVRDHFSSWFGTLEAFRNESRRVFFVGFQETLADDFESLRQRLGLPPDVRLPSDGYGAHRGSADEPRDLNPEAQRNLREWYAADIAFLTYCRDRFH